MRYETRKMDDDRYNQLRDTMKKMPEKTKETQYYTKGKKVLAKWRPVKQNRRVDAEAQVIDMFCGGGECH